MYIYIYIYICRLHCGSRAKKRKPQPKPRHQGKEGKARPQAEGQEEEGRRRAEGLPDILRYQPPRVLSCQTWLLASRGPPAARASRTARLGQPAARWWWRAGCRVHIGGLRLASDDNGSAPQARKKKRSRRPAAKTTELRPRFSSRYKYNEVSPRIPPPVDDQSQKQRGCASGSQLASKDLVPVAFCSEHSATHLLNFVALMPIAPALGSPRRHLEKRARPCPGPQARQIGPDISAAGLRLTAEAKPVCS
jgi:hypothetical protein